MFTQGCARPVKYSAWRISQGKLTLGYYLTPLRGLKPDRSTTKILIRIILYELFLVMDRMTRNLTFNTTLKKGALESANGPPAFMPRQGQNYE